MKWGAIEPMSLAELAQVCVQNATDAARGEAEARAAYSRLTPGDPAVGEAACDIVRYRADQWHWRSYAAYYRARAAKEGGSTLVPLPRGMAAIAERVKPAPADPAPDPRLPREPGGDDADLPF